MTCGFGVHTVGRVLILYGVCDALASLGLGFLVKTTGRIPILMSGFFINLAVSVVLLLWKPSLSSIAGIVSQLKTTL